MCPLHKLHFPRTARNGIKHVGTLTILMISFVLYHRVNQDYISAPVQFLQQLLIVFKVSPDTSSKQVILQLNDERAEFV